MKIFNTVFLGLAHANTISKKDFCFNTIELPCAEGENCPKWRCPEGTGHGKSCEQFCSITNAEAVGIRTCVCYRQSGSLRLFVGCRWVEAIEQKCPKVDPEGFPLKPKKSVSDIIRRPHYSASVARKSSAPTRDSSTSKNVSIFRAMGVQKPKRVPTALPKTTASSGNQEDSYPQMASLGIKLEDLKVNLKSAGANDHGTFADRSEKFENCVDISADSFCESDGLVLRCKVECRNRKRVNRCTCVNGNCQWSSKCGISNERSIISEEPEKLNSIRTLKVEDGNFINLNDFINLLQSWLPK